MSFLSNIEPPPAFGWLSKIDVGLAGALPGFADVIGAEALAPNKLPPAFEAAPYAIPPPPPRGAWPNYPAPPSEPIAPKALEPPPNPVAPPGAEEPIPAAILP